MTLWEWSQIGMRGFEFKIRAPYVIEFKSLSLFYNLKQQFKQSLCQSI